MAASSRRSLRAADQEVLYRPGKQIAEARIGFEVVLEQADDVEQAVLALGVLTGHRAPGGVDVLGPRQPRCKYQQSNETGGGRVGLDDPGADVLPVHLRGGIEGR